LTFQKQAESNKKKMDRTVKR